MAAANAAIEAGAAATGALVLDLRDFRGRNLVMADHVHPTAFGQIALAERALAVLAADGLPPRVHPSALIVWDETPRGRLRGDVTYAWRHLKVSLRAARLRLAALRREAAARSLTTRGRESSVLSMTKEARSRGAHRRR